MKRHASAVALVVMTLLLPGCGDAKDAKLSELDDPDVKKALLEELTPQERKLLQTYLVRHAANNDIGAVVTVEDAIAEQEKQNDAAADNARQGADVASQSR